MTSYCMVCELLFVDNLLAWDFCIARQVCVETTRTNKLP